MSKHAFGEVYTPDFKAALSAAKSALAAASDEPPTARRKIDFGSASSTSHVDDPVMSEPVAQARAYGQPFFWETGRKSYRRSRYSRSYRPTQRRRFKSRPVKKPVSVLLSQSRALIKKLRRKR